MNDRAGCRRGTLAAALLMMMLGSSVQGIALGAPAGAGPEVSSPQATSAAPTGPPAAPPTDPRTAQPTDPSTAPPSAEVPHEATEDIRDIRGPKPVLATWLLAAVLAGGVLLALAAYGAWRWRQRQHPRALLPFETALQRLEEIRALMQPAAAREFSIAVSDIVRRYIEQRFGVIATHRTTEEFLHDLLETSNPSLARHRDVLAEFLNQCDLVKFAGMSLSLQSMESLHHSARAFVLETAKPDEVEIRQPLQTTQGAHDSLPST